MSAPRTNQHKSPWFHSPYVLIVLFLIAAMAVALLVPPKMLDAADGVETKYRVLVSKLSNFLSSQENPDVVVMGSSLVLMPSVRCDEKADGKKPCYEPWFYDRLVPEYTKSDYFEKLLKNKLGLNLSIKNLGVASSIMSDQQGIFEAILSTGKKPRLVILGVAPRDFLDNTFPNAAKTPTHSFLTEFHDNSILPASFTAEGLQAYPTKLEHRFKKVMAYVKTHAIDVACNVSKHPATAEYTSSGGDGTERPNKLSDLERYKKLYNPPNYEMLNTQAGYLRDFLISAEHHGVNVLIVNMPLTRQNLAALNSDALKEYKRQINHLAMNYNATFLDLGSTSSYSLNDFEDCCHLNSKGGRKFFDDLIASVQSDRSLHDYLATVSRSKKGMDVAAVGTEMKKPM